MNVSDFTYLLQNPESLVSPVQTKQLEDVLEEYPYFQAARAVHLKGLRNLNSFKYNNALKITAAYTADRDVLFDLITSKDFLQNTIADTISGKKLPLVEKEVEAEEVTAEPGSTQEMIEASTDEPLPRSIKDADNILDPALFKSLDPEVDKSLDEAKKKAAEELQLGQPLPFTRKEKYSFAEWLQLTSLKKDPAAKLQEEKEEETPPENTAGESTEQDESLSREEKFELIDKFIKNNPKIDRQPESLPKVDIKASTKLDKAELMTETLAKVYLEQGKYKNAIQAYKILSLKYPEKSSFFADRIKAVKKLQKDN
ncbi:hypothetical protein [Zeaxanthinibacter enoshimensis]|uniref:Tetratricopeptide repeat protein n=1 Tax=Zeaxanthinibacter enoshimensis TaxID=392009 RepID=A0A4R6TRY8_9FLAO|nr:hypothetical protein [Zeaxanthinibacter enoshimensis]TDQ33336.1 hypothetical protein CLV82_1175 [Zeaxanthinibacter enoshimensis]